MCHPNSGPGSRLAAALISKTCLTLHKVPRYGAGGVMPGPARLCKCLGLGLTWPLAQDTGPGWSQLSRTPERKVRVTLRARNSHSETVAREQDDVNTKPAKKNSQY